LVRCELLEVNRAIITIRKSKTDQERKRRDVAIPQMGGSICPIRAIECWLEASGIVEGPVFRRIDRSGRISKAALSADAVSVILKRRLKETSGDTSIIRATAFVLGS
jgi:hypothetical protein